MSKRALWATVAALMIAVVVLTNAVVRLENYRYADSVGMCSEFSNRDDSAQRRQREKCLLNSQTRTHWLWHVLYGTRIL